MNIENENASHADQEGPSVKPGPCNPSDWFLKTLVSLAESESPVTMGITLSVGGLLISGTTTDTKSYFANFGAEIAGANPSSSAEIAQRMRAKFEELGSYVADQTKSDDGVRNAYIHLRQARVFHPGGRPIPLNKRTWWRVKVDAVDGFALGSLTTDDDK